MTVTIKQREPDKHTQEQHIYIKYHVIMIKTTYDGLGNHYIKVIHENGRQNTYPLQFFDLEVHP